MTASKSTAPDGIFISYASADGSHYSQTLRTRVEAELPDFPVWQDISDMAAGKRWWPQIEEALEAVECMVLLLTPGSIRSAYTTREWRYCRQNAVPVVPVLVPDVPLDDVAIPPWMREIHWFDLENSTDWQKFVGQLHNPPPLDRVPFMAPDVPDGFVDRPAEFGQLVGQVLQSDGERPLAITTALHGAGGFGKTTLATKLCHADDVVMEFVDGILWVTLGETPNVLAELTSVYAALTGDRGAGFGTEHDAATAIAEHLEHRRCLLVIDDVWNQAHLQPFLRGGPKCSRLITTRQVNIAVNARCEQPVLVDEMRPDEAVAMLGVDDHREHADQLADLAQRLGEWPLMLELASSALRKRMHMWDASFDAALQYVTKVLDRRGVTGLGIKDDASRQASVNATMDISLQHLDDVDRQAAVELSVFAEDVDVPPRALEALWDVDDLEVEERIDRLVSSSLVRLNTGDDSVRLHDVVREYLGTQLDGADAVHARLIENWGDIHALPDVFAWQWVGYHLLESGQSDRLHDLLFDPTWLDARIAVVHPNRLIADAERWMDLDSRTATPGRLNTQDGQECPSYDDMRLLRDAIRLSSYLTADDPHQLPGQLVGRLNSASESNPHITAFIDQIHDTRPRPTLLPRNSILNQAGGPLVRTLSGHSGSVQSVCVTPDGRHAVSASDDQTLKVWDLASGEELRTLSGHSGTVYSVCVTPDGRHAVSASDDQTLKVWDLATGELIGSFSAEEWFTACGISPDGRFVVAGEYFGRMHFLTLTGLGGPTATGSA